MDNPQNEDAVELGIGDDGSKQSKSQAQQPPDPLKSGNKAADVQDPQVGKRAGRLNSRQILGVAVGLVLALFVVIAAPLLAIFGPTEQGVSAEGSTQSNNTSQPTVLVSPPQPTHAPTDVTMAPQSPTRRPKGLPSNSTPAPVTAAPQTFGPSTLVGSTSVPTLAPVVPSASPPPVEKAVTADRSWMVEHEILLPEEAGQDETFRWQLKTYVDPVSHGTMIVAQSKNYLHIMHENGSYVQSLQRPLHGYFTEGLLEPIILCNSTEVVLGVQGQSIEGERLLVWLYSITRSDLLEELDTNLSTFVVEFHHSGSCVALSTCPDVKILCGSQEGYRTNFTLTLFTKPVSRLGITGGWSSINARVKGEDIYDMKVIQYRNAEGALRVATLISWRSRLVLHSTIRIWTVDLLELTQFSIPSDGYALSAFTDSSSQSEFFIVFSSSTVDFVSSSGQILRSVEFDWRHRDRVELMPFTGGLLRVASPSQVLVVPFPFSNLSAVSAVTAEEVQETDPEVLAKWFGFHTYLDGTGALKFLRVDQNGNQDVRYQKLVRWSESNEPSPVKSVSVRPFVLKPVAPLPPIVSAHSYFQRQSGGYAFLRFCRLVESLFLYRHRFATDILSPRFRMAGAYIASGFESKSKDAALVFGRRLENSNMSLVEIGLIGKLEKLEALVNNEMERHELPGKSGEITALEVVSLKNGKHLIVSVAEDRGIRVWSAESRSLLHMWHTSSPVIAVSILNAFKESVLIAAGMREFDARGDTQLRIQIYTIDGQLQLELLPSGIAMGNSVSSSWLGYYQEVEYDSKPLLGLELFENKGDIFLIACMGFRGSTIFNARSGQVTHALPYWVDLDAKHPGFFQSATYKSAGALRIVLRHAFGFVVYSPSERIFLSSSETYSVFLEEPHLMFHFRANDKEALALGKGLIYYYEAV